MRADHYQLIRQLAGEHILKGGGIVPSDGVHEGDPIAAVANMAFGANAADQQFDRSIAGLDRTLHEDIFAAVWQLVSAYQDAAYTFGAAVGLQLIGFGMLESTDDAHSVQLRSAQKPPC